MRIVYIGTPDFAVASLKKLVESGKNIVGVITAPDKPAGRNQKLKCSPVKEYALSQGLHILQPTNLKDTDFLNELDALHADLQIVVAFRMLPEAVWNRPHLGSFNLHASLLPQYRGAAPINHAIINGESETGVTTFFLRHEIDTGNIILQKKVSIQPEDNAGSLHDKLMEVGADLLLETVNLIEQGNYETNPQDSLIENTAIKHAPKIFKPFCEIDWSMDLRDIHNKVRGLSPYPCAYTHARVGDDFFQLKIYSTRFDSTISNKTLTQVTVKGNLGISNENGTLWLEEVQIEGKKKMNIAEVLNGTRGELKIVLI